MDKVIMYCMIGVVFVAVLVALTVWVLRFVKMTPEEKKKYLKTYLKGVVALAEQEIIGTKKGQERLQMVEDYFNKKAPLTYKMVLLFLGKSRLKEIIDEALKEIKNTFEK